MIKEAIFVIVFSLYGGPIDDIEVTEDYYGSIRIETRVPSMAMCEKMKAAHIIQRDNAMSEDDTIENAQVYLFCNEVK